MRPGEPPAYESAETLYKIPAVAGEVLSNRGGWRDTGY